ncbi:MAG: DUF2793 domain-containing protein [Pseudomonadota bacterium]
MSLYSYRLDLPYLAEAQAQKHVTINEGIRRLDAMVHLGVQSTTLATEPAAPSEGDAYILPAGAAGSAWDHLSTDDVVVRQDGAWTAYAPVLGMSAYSVDDGAVMVYDGTQWKALNQPAEIGVNTAPDSTNRLSVKSDAVLLSHDDVTPGSGDMRLTLNKASVTDTVSVVFQSAFAGKAEFGLTGTDNFSIKVADDQGTFREALVIDRQTGAVSFPNTPT